VLRVLLIETKRNNQKNRKEKGMKNIEMTVEGKILTIKIDLSKDFGRSTSGKSIIIATSEGNQAVAPGIMAGINVYKKA
jgi:hypothetical protein